MAGAPTGPQGGRHRRSLGPCPPRSPRTCGPTESFSSEKVRIRHPCAGYGPRPRVLRRPVARSARNGPAPRSPERKELAALRTSHVEHRDQRGSGRRRSQRQLSGLPVDLEDTRVPSAAEARRARGGSGGGERCPAGEVAPAPAPATRPAVIARAALRGLAGSTRDSAVTRLTKRPSQFRQAS